VAVVGGGSTYTPELVDGLCDIEDRIAVDDLVLLDPSDMRREVVGGLSERILRERGWNGTFSTTADPHAALEGADFVVVQLRIGGQAARHVDETLPVGYGCLGQETVGAGGLAKALRTVPVVLELAEEMAARANPGAWLVDFTNPVGIVTQALLDEGHRAVGLCNVAIWAQRRIGHYLGVDPDDVAVEHVGLNHLTWIRSARTVGASGAGAGAVDGAVDGDGAAEGGQDRLGDLFERFGPELELESGVPIEVLRLQHALPSYYVHYYYQHDADVAQQAAPGYRSRADVVAELETKLLEEYRDPTLVSKPAALSYRGGAYYSLAAVRLMASLHAGTGSSSTRRPTSGWPSAPPAPEAATTWCARCWPTRSWASTRLRPSWRTNSSRRTGAICPASSRRDTGVLPVVISALPARRPNGSEGSGD
jgi:6-phospho-beta-glucosidase